jgi:hypothetical protein
MKNCESLLNSLGIALRATPTAPATNGWFEVSVGKEVLPPVPLPAGSQPWTTQSSTLWLQRMRRLRILLPPTCLLVTF